MCKIYSCHNHIVVGSENKSPLEYSTVLLLVLFVFFFSILLKGPRAH